MNLRLSKGEDPSTDVNRSQGVLAIIQVSWSFFSHPNVALIGLKVLVFLECRLECAREIYKASMAKGKEGWPFMCVSIGFTRDVMALLRKGKLNKYCNTESDVFSVVNKMYIALFTEFHRWSFLLFWHPRLTTPKENNDRQIYGSCPAFTADT